MSSKFAVVQFSPDPLAEEKMNIGVVVWDEERARVRFVERWNRLKRFAGPQLGLAKDFVDVFEKDLDRLSGKSVGEEIEKMVGDLNHSVQLTPARGSLESADDLIERLAVRYLPQGPQRRKRRRNRPNRRSAAATAQRALREAVEKQLPDRVDELVHARQAIAGQLQHHEFDAVLANGKTRAAINGLSLAVGNRQSMQRDVDVIAWALDDVRKKFPRLPLAVYVIKPATADGRAVFETAQQTYAGLNAQLIDSVTDLKTWSRDQVALIVPNTSEAKKRELLEQV